MSKTLLVYDYEGEIWHWSAGDNKKEPIGLPYMLIDSSESNGRSIIGVDVSVNPHVPIYEKTKEELEFEELTLDEYREKRQLENKSALANFLKSNPILWTDELYYGVTQEDQNEMALDLTTYQLKKNLGDENWKLQWHSIKSDCRNFTEEEFIGLLNAIIEFVYPYRQLEMKYKEAIYTAKTKEEIAEINLSYELGVLILNED